MPAPLPSDYPTHAVIKLKNSDDVCKLLRLLIDNGYADVSFMTGAPDNLKKLTGSNTSANGVPTSTELSRFPAAPNAFKPNTLLGGGLFPGLMDPQPLSLQTMAAALSRSVGASMSNSIFPTAPPSLLSSYANSSLLAAAAAGGQGVDSPSSLLSPPQSDSSSTGSANNGASSTETAINTVLAQVVRQGPHQNNGASNTDVMHCRMCNNPIKTNRFSNLLNHVRRHAAVKQFKCVYCDYQHNETAKVRLHMLHNHEDADAVPIDKWSPELQSVWENLLTRCFPTSTSLPRNRSFSPSVSAEMARFARRDTARASHLPPTMVRPDGSVAADEWKTETEEDDEEMGLSVSSDDGPILNGQPSPAGSTAGIDLLVSAADASQRSTSPSCVTPERRSERLRRRVNQCPFDLEEDEPCPKRVELGDDSPELGTKKESE